MTSKGRMMLSRWLLAGLLTAAMVGTACGDTADDSATASTPSASLTYPQPTPPFNRGRVLLSGSEGSVLIDVEVAETDQQRQLGLMYRTSLPEDAGMIFIYFEPSYGGYWMKNTLIPLSIAYFDEEGTILRIMDMEPCKADPCPTYDPGVSYLGTLEVNKGAFDEWGVSEGDEIRLIHNDRDNM